MILYIFFLSWFVCTYICMHTQASVFPQTFMYITQAENSQSFAWLLFTVKIFWAWEWTILASSFPWKYSKYLLKFPIFCLILSKIFGRRNTTSEKTSLFHIHYCKLTIEADISDLILQCWKSVMEQRITVQ